MERATTEEELLKAFKCFCYVTASELFVIKPPCFGEVNRKCMKYVETQ
jgi:hypothetical protein